jgi:hypothetical protein
MIFFLIWIFDNYPNKSIKQTPSQQRPSCQRNSALFMKPDGLLLCSLSVRFEFLMMYLNQFLLVQK